MDQGTEWPAPRRGCSRVFQGQTRATRSHVWLPLRKPARPKPCEGRLSRPNVWGLRSRPPTVTALHRVRLGNRFTPENGSSSGMTEWAKVQSLWVRQFPKIPPRSPRLVCLRVKTISLRNFGVRMERRWRARAGPRNVFRSAIPRGSISPPRGVAVASFIRTVSLGAGAEDAPGFTVDHALEDHPQAFRIARVRQRLFLRHFAREHQLLERLIKTLHALG